jgi:Wiskott-Aldrich syndrome protein
MPAPTPIAPPTPPKPPAEGSSFIPDTSPAAPAGNSTPSSPVSIKPEPFPLPTSPPSTPSSESNKPAAAAITLASPLPAASKGPSVTFYDEQEYVCRPGDTWGEISKQFYVGTDRYARALQRHNQNHPRASEQMMSNGQLTAGTKIFIPQSHILEERYADAIPKPTTATPPTMMPAKFDQSGSPPPPPPAPPPATGSVPPPRNP